MAGLKRVDRFHPIWHAINLVGVKALFYLVCYDIVDNRDRYQVVKIMQNYGVRVQKSVFECPGLNERQFITMKHALESRIDHTCDSVRYYGLCRGCLRQVAYSGIESATLQDGFRII